MLSSSVSTVKGGGSALEVATTLGIFSVYPRPIRSAAAGCIILATGGSYEDVVACSVIDCARGIADAAFGGGIRRVSTLHRARSGYGQDGGYGQPYLRKRR